MVHRPAHHAGKYSIKHPVVYSLHMNEILLRLERATGLGPTKAARLLGVAYVTYAQYRSQHRSLQKYHARHIEAILLLSRRDLDRLIERYVHDSNQEG